MDWNERRKHRGGNGESMRLTWLAIPFDFYRNWLWSVLIDDTIHVLGYRERWMDGRTEVIHKVNRRGRYFSFNSLKITELRCNNNKNIGREHEKEVTKRTIVEWRDEYPWCTLDGRINRNGYVTRSHSWTKVDASSSSVVDGGRVGGWVDEFGFVGWLQIPTMRAYAKQM